MISVKENIFNKLQDVKNSDNTLSDFTIFNSVTNKWFSIKVDNKTLIKIYYPSSKRNYIVEFDDLSIETNDPVSIINQNLDKIKKVYKEISSISDDEMFGCCSSYMICSDEKKCIKDNKFSRNCYYKQNLENGKIFYGKNRNV